MTNSFLRSDEKKRYWAGINTSGKYVLSMVYALAPCTLIHFIYPKISYGILLIYVPTVFLCAQLLFWVGRHAKTLEQKIGESREERTRRLRQILGEKRPQPK